jgi:outer membrane protein TolC
MAYLQAIYDYNVAVAALERATGMILLPDDPIGQDLE